VSIGRFCKAEAARAAKTLGHCEQDLSRVVRFEGATALTSSGHPLVGGGGESTSTKVNKSAPRRPIPSSNLARRIAWRRAGPTAFSACLFKGSGG